LPVLDIAELEHHTEQDETGETHCVRIEEKTIQRMGELVTIAEKHNLNVNIQECVLMDARIESCSIDMSFDFSIFRTKMDLSGGVFYGKLKFSDSFFEKETDLSRAVFKQDISFEGCTFYEEVSFFEAIVEREAAIMSCDFEGEVTFDNASFADRFNLSESTFEKRVRCNGAVFKKTVDLSGSVFEEGLDSTGSNLPDVRKDDFADQGGHEHRFQQERRKASQSHLWRQSAKKFTRRQLLRGIFRFLPDDREK